MNKLTKQKRDQLILVVMGTLIALAAIWFGLISNRQAALAKAGKDANEIRERVEKAEALLARADEITGQLEHNGEQLAAIEKGMAAGDMYAWIITTVNQFIAPHRVSIPAFSLPVVRDHPLIPKFPYRSATFTVRGEAHYHDFGFFLADFENSFPYFFVQNIKLAPGGGQERLEFEFDIVTLIKPDA